MYFNKVSFLMKFIHEKIFNEQLFFVTNLF